MANGGHERLVSPGRLDSAERTGQRAMVLVLLATVVLLDQTIKWWGWRHISEAIVNPGGDVLVGRAVGRWYAHPVVGCVLDLLGAAFLTITLFVLVRRPRPAAVLTPAALMIGGWSSNLLDRVGLHHWTAPGSVRGAIDVIPIGRYYYNVADVVILGATLLFALSVSCLYRKPPLPAPVRRREDDREDHGHAGHPSRMSRSGSSRGGIDGL